AIGRARGHSGPQAHRRVRPLTRRDDDVPARLRGMLRRQAHKGGGTHVGPGGGPPRPFSGHLLAVAGRRRRRPRDAPPPPRARPPPGGLAAFTKAGAPKFFLTLVGGGHTPPYRGASAPAPTTVAHVTLDFFDRYLKSDRGALERLRKDADQPGVATLQEHVQT